jgi:hypothetical protein
MDGDHDEIQENVLRVRAAVNIDASLKKMEQCFQIYMQYNSASCFRDYKIMKTGINTKINRYEE